MRVLVIGGSVFLGPHLVDALHAGGHDVTIFNRGQARATPPAGVEFIRGDRERDLGLLEGRAWDSVIDTCGFVPRIVRESVRLLASRVAQYVFVSSISAYADPLGGNFDESEPLATLPDPTVEAITGDTYGGLKALCEKEVARNRPDRAMIVRPGLIVGPLDPTDRFTYWPHRFALGGEAIVPAPATHGISFIDVRDLAAWIVHAVERSISGEYNAAGDVARTSMGDLVEACRAAAAANAARPEWVPAQFLLDRGVTPWGDLPLWLAEGQNGILRAKSAKADAASLRHRPISQTVADTLAWSRSAGMQRTLKAGLSAEREAQLLAQWHAAQALRAGAGSGGGA